MTKLGQILSSFDLAPALGRLAPGWRGPLLAALVALFAGSLSVFTLPALDRDESRFAQATAQMLETGDLTVIKFQDQPRFKKPVGIHWLQAASVSAFSSPEARQIWAYRLPSLLGAMLAAAACAWGAAAFFTPGTAMLAGVLLASTGLLSTEASIAKTDAVLCGAITLSMAALGRIYASRHGGAAVGRWTKAAFWGGMALATLVKGPLGPLIPLLTCLTLWGADRDGAWLRKVGWGWGPLLFGLVVLPWAMAITVATDGGFWTTAVVGDLAPKLAGGQEGHGAPPGYHALLIPFLIFPGSLLLPAALVLAWRQRRDSGVRFALAWLIPTWLLFELLPTKLVHYTLPGFGGLAWLLAAAVLAPMSRRLRWSGAACGLIAALLFAAIAAVGLAQYGDRADAGWAVLTVVLYLTAGVVGAVLLLRGKAANAAAAAVAFGVLAHGALAGGLLPGLDPLWLSKRAAILLQQDMLDPRSGLIPGPVAVAGYAEPSLVFALGTRTGLDDAHEAAVAIAEGRPAIVDASMDTAFHDALAEQGADARTIGVVRGINYSNGDATTLLVYAPPVTTPALRVRPDAPAAATAPAAPRP
jgi:4-amino-4-deoxy-L-arabinose transferase-like glycosyltransferase